MLPERIVFEGEDVKSFLDILWEYGLQVANFDNENNFPDDQWVVYERPPEEDNLEVSVDG